uniref:Non-specific serine/threonine protein kinase n=1 Tax=Kalanchoe fedtschenkoi TaxID=63787 RepID=A0A7N0TW19_KALFE
MGQKKKKKSGGGRRNKGLASQSKDHSLHADLSEEITALCAIFQDDCKIVSESPPQIIIKLRPYSKDTAYEDSDLFAHLTVRFLPGYPHKCPKLQINPEKGLSKDDTAKLESLLHDQATSNAKEGRVMIYNLVEAAQEFLSQIVPVNETGQPAPGLLADTITQSVLTSVKSTTRGPFVFGYIDLFSDDSLPWVNEMHENDVISSSRQSPKADDLKLESQVQQTKFEKDAKPFTKQKSKQRSSVGILGTVEEESHSEDDHKTVSDSSTSLEETDADNNSNNDERDWFLAQPFGEMDDSEQEDELSESSSAESSGHDLTSQHLEKDLLMVHLLRLACASKRTLADALPTIASELNNIGILPDWVRDLATKPSTDFKRTFDSVFQHHMIASRISQFWEPATNIGGHPNSRYLNDFEELRPLGHGGFGHVVLCKNKLDGRHYAVKKIRLKDKSPPLNDRILREVATLSRLQHYHVVRYYQAWFEFGIGGGHVDTAGGSATEASGSFSFRASYSADVNGHDEKLESTYLYIQMEYCPRTLRQVFESYTQFDKDSAWHMFRQIVEGLAHIHGQGIIHRDLTPNNIFFDARNDIKIGDFGLAKFLKLEQLDQEATLPLDTPGVSIDGTGQVGTYFYTAPEIEQGWPKIDEKADMYSLGVVFFELWHPFGTAMERNVILSELKQKGQLPPTWVSEYPKEASLLRRLMCTSPSDRPSAMELLQHEFPPRMEHELVDNIVRTMKTSEDKSVYDKVVNAIFDGETLSKNHNSRNGRWHLVGVGTSAMQCTDLQTEFRDHIIEITRDVFKRYCGKRLEILPMHLYDDSSKLNRNSVKLLTQGGDMIVLCHELRSPFVNWIVRNQKSSVKRYEIANVYRRAIGHSTPNRYLQGDFDIIGGTSGLTEAEIIKVTMDIATYFFHSDACDIHLNHGDLIEAIWSWAGIKAERRHKVAELLSMMRSPRSLRLQPSEQRSKWVLIRRQLQQELNLAEAVLNRLQTIGLRFCGPADQVLPRLRGALPADKATRKALDDLSNLYNYLRILKIEENVFIDAFMTPTEYYHRDLYFQVYLIKESSLIEGALLAVGGRYDFLLHQMWEQENKSLSPGGVGVSVALETIIQHSSTEVRHFRNDASISVLVCSRGGGGLLEQRMDLVAELREKGIKAEFVPVDDPSLTQQYEYASEHDIKCLVIITDAGISQTGFVKVRHLEVKRDKDVERENLVKFLIEATTTQFRNPAIWN